MIIELDHETFKALGGFGQPSYSEVIEPWLKALNTPEMPAYMALGRALQVTSVRWVGEGVAEVRVILKKTSANGKLVQKWITPSVAPPPELLRFAEQAYRSTARSSL